MLVEINYIYDGKFDGKILVVILVCGKTIFVQNLAKNQMFGKFQKVIWASKILLSKEREEQIEKCFVDEKIDFMYVETIDDFDDLLEHIQRKKINCNENSLGENIELDCLIVLDDVSGLVDRSDTFAIFLTVSQKFGRTCMYVFHTLYPTRQNWQLILAQTKILNIFPGSLQTSLTLKFYHLFVVGI